MDNYRDRYVSLRSCPFLGGGLAFGPGLAQADHWKDYWVDHEEASESPYWTNERFFDVSFDFWRTRDLLLSEKVCSLLQKYVDKSCKGTVKNIEFDDLWYPSDWTWRHEHLGIHLDVDYKKIYAFAKSREEEFEKYLSLNFQSRSQWVSKIPYRFAKLRRSEFLWDILIEYFLLVSIGYPLGVYDHDSEYMEELNDYTSEDLTPDFVESEIGICGCNFSECPYCNSYSIYRKST